MDPTSLFPSWVEASAPVVGHDLKFQYAFSSEESERASGELPIEHEAGLAIRRAHLSGEYYRMKNFLGSVDLSLIPYI